MRLRNAVWPLLPLVLGACAGEVALQPGTAPELLVGHGSGSATETQPPVVTRRISIAAVGDIMLGSDFPDSRLPATGGYGLLSGAAVTLQSADIAFGNLEGVLLDGGEPVKQCHNPSSCYLFRTPSHYAEGLATAGFDGLSLANNHARDFGEEGRSATMAALDAAGIQHSGRLGDVATWEVQGLKVAMIAFAPFGGSHDMLDLPLAAKQVAALEADNDLVVVSMHAGAEGSEALRLPFAREEYYGEDRGDAVRFAHAMVDAGADLVFGHGPHVPRAVELYQGRLIAYSLGNFATYRGFNIRGENGLAPLLLTELDEEGAFVSGRLHAFVQQRPHGTLADERLRVVELMARLTAEDFPDGELDIAGDGRIHRRPPPQAPPVAKLSRQPSVAQIR